MSTPGLERTVIILVFPAVRSTKALKMERQQRRVVGSLSIRLLAGRKIKAIIPGSILRWQSDRSNPRVTIEYNGETWQSAIMRSTLEPTWKEECRFKIYFPCRHHEKFKILLSHEQMDDEVGSSCLLGSIDYPIFPVLQSPSSSCKEWISVFDEEDNLTGELLVAFHYDPVGRDPQIRDTVQWLDLLPTEGMDKVVPSIEARLKVMDVQRDRILVQYKSTEGWKVQLECPRNFVFVVRSSGRSALRQLTQQPMATMLEQTTYLSEARKKQLQ